MLYKKKMSKNELKIPKHISLLKSHFELNIDAMII